jgi:hypothetical protein
MGNKAPTPGSLFDDGKPALLASLGARLVSNEEMGRDVESDAFDRETHGLNDGDGCRRHAR